MIVKYIVGVHITAELKAYQFLFLSLCHAYIKVGEIFATVYVVLTLDSWN